MKKKILPVVMLAFLGLVGLSQVNASQSVIANVAADTVWVITDDLDSAWTWNNFGQDDKAGCYGGSQHNVEGVGEIAECTFTGSTIEIYGETWGGGPTAEVFIDGVSKGIVSQDLPDSDSKLYATITELGEGEHTFKYVTIGGWCAIDYIRAKTISTPSYVIVDNLNSAWTWNNFVEDTDGKEACYGGSQHVAEGVGEIAECTFTGSSIEVYGEMWDGAPVITIFIDGDSIGDFSEHNTGDYLVSGLFATINGLTEGDHVAKFVTKGEWAGIDYIKVFSSATVETAPDSVTGLSATALSSTVIKLEWTISTNALGYTVWRKTGTDGAFAEIVDIEDALAASYSDSTVVEATQYFYKVVAWNNIDDAPESIEVTATTPIGVGIANSTAFEFSIYPNPASSSVNLKIADSGTLTIYDLQGKTLVSKSITSLNSLIDISYLHSGLYSVCFISNNKTYMQKLVVK